MARSRHLGDTELNTPVLKPHDHVATWLWLIERNVISTSQQSAVKVGCHYNEQLVAHGWFLVGLAPINAPSLTLSLLDQDIRPFSTELPVQLSLPQDRTYYGVPPVSRFKTRPGGSPAATSVKLA